MMDGDSHRGAAENSAWILCCVDR